MSAVLPFLVGGLVDCIGQGPIGYWMLVYLLGHAAAVFGADAWRRGFLQLWTGVGATLALLGLAGWLLACGYHFRWLDWRPFALAAAAATLLFPLLAVVLTPLRWLGSSRALLQLGRGG